MFYIFYIFIAFIIVRMVYALLGFKKIAKWTEGHRQRLSDTNIIISLLAIIGLVFTVLAFDSQQHEFTKEQQRRLDEAEAQQRIETENELVYLENSRQDIENASSTTSYILNNMSEWHRTLAFVVNKYSTPSLAKIVDDKNLDKETRATIINAIWGMDTANNLLSLLSSDNNIDRNVTLTKLEGVTKTIQSLLSDLNKQLKK